MLELINYNNVHLLELGLICLKLGGVTSMDPFLEKFFPDVYGKETSITPSDNQYCKFNSQTLTLFTSSLYLAAFVSSLFLASWITKLFGRKRTMMLGGFLFTAGAILNGFAQNLAMLICGRLLLGFGIGFANQVHTIFFYYFFISFFFDKIISLYLDICTYILYI